MTEEYHPYETAGSLITGAAPRADFVGQSTTIEVGRAVAEVAALVEVAQRRPRNEERALQQMLRSTKIYDFADKAYYDYPKGETNVRDLAIGAVKELARCWTNMQFAVVELSQDLANHQSEMLAWAWDMQHNNRVERRRVIPHVRDSKAHGRRTITDFREIGEILGNWAARQLRECIKDVLPPWYIDAAKAGFNDTLTAKLKNQPIEVVRTKAIQSFEDEFEVSREQLETYLNRGSGKWTVHDVARLRSLHTAITQGDKRVEDVFDPDVLTPEDVANAPVDATTAERIQAMTKKPPAAEQSASNEDEDTTSARLAMLAQITAQLDRLEINTEQFDDTVRLLTLGAAAALLDLTPEQATMVHNRLAGILDTTEPVNEIDAVLDAARGELADRPGQGAT